MIDDIDRLTARLADPAFFLEPDFTALLRHLRDRSPVHWCQAWPQRGFWAITRHADVRWALEHPELLSSEAAGNIIPADPELHRQDRGAMGFGVMLTNTDPPNHARLRRIYSRFFSGPQVAKLEGQCQQIVDEILAELDGRDRFDFVADVAAPLPARLICRLLGVPRDDWPFIFRYANSFASFADPALQLGETPGETFMIAMRTTFDYVSDLVAQRRAEPRDDLCSMAALATAEGEPLSHAEAAWNAWAILAAGFETSRNAISGGLLALIEHPDQADTLRGEPGLLTTAVEEMFRWSNPATAILRVARADIEIAGQPIVRGDWLALFMESANRDERVFDDPYRFDIRRRRNPHLSFGFGIHNCIGRMLAGLEVRVMIRTILERAGRIELDGSLERGASTIAKGLVRMPVRVAWTAPRSEAA